MQYIFQLSIIASFIFFCFFGITIYLIGHWALHILSKHASHDALSIPIGGFIGTIATAWALSLGFVSADIWGMNARADQATSVERSSIARILGSASPEILDAPQLFQTMMEYRQAVTNDEWQALKNSTPAPSVDKALQKIRKEIVNLSKKDIPSPIISQLVHDFDELQDARNERLSVGATSVDMYKWYLVISLTLLTMITIASTHADRKRAGIKAMTIFSISAAVCLWILAVHANPYHGAEPIDPSELIVQSLHQ